MNSGMPFNQLRSAETIPQESIFPMSMGDGSGTKKVTKELLEEEIRKDLKIGDLEELQTKNKESLVEAINEAAKSGGSGSLDVLDTKEEIEANTEPEKPAGALGVKEMFDALNNKLNGCSLEQDGEDFYIVGADSVRKKLGESIAYLAGTVSKNTASSTTIDCTGMDGYQYLTVNNFFLSDIVCYASRTAGSMSNDSTITATPVLSYNSDTGILTISSKNNGATYLKVILYSFKVWVIPGVTRS